jgi:hypothetical protein
MMVIGTKKGQIMVRKQNYCRLKRVLADMGIYNGDIVLRSMYIRNCVRKGNNGFGKDKAFAKNGPDKAQGQEARYNTGKDEKARTYSYHPADRRLYTLLRDIERAVLANELLFYGGLFKGPVTIDMKKSLLAAIYVRLV